MSVSGDVWRVSLVRNLYFVRHAESLANELDVLTGRLDCPLSEVGRKQAREIAGGFAKEHEVELVVTSPLKRAWQTAEFFIEAQGGPPRIVRPELAEVHVGRYSGMTYTELDSTEGYVHQKDARWNWVPDGGGESYSMVADRVRGIFDWLETRDECDILLVTHGVSMRLLHAHLKQTLPEYLIPIPKNGEIWKVRYEGYGVEYRMESLFYLDDIVERRA